MSQPPQQIEVSAKPIDRPNLELPPADEINFRDVEWFVLTQDNFDDKVAELQESGRPIVFIALTDKGYENLGLNLSDLRAYVMQQQAIIAAYKAYYEKAEDAMEGAVKQ